MAGGQAGGAERAVLLLGVLEDDDLNAVVERHDRVAHARCRRFAVALAFGAGCAHDLLFHALAYTPARSRLQPRRHYCTGALPYRSGSNTGKFMSPALTQARRTGMPILT